MLIYLAYAMAGTDMTEPPEVGDFRRFANSLGHVTFSPCFHNPLPERPMCRPGPWPAIEDPLWDWLDAHGGKDAIRKPNFWYRSRALSPLALEHIKHDGKPIGLRYHEIVDLDLNLMEMAEMVVINLRPSRAGVPQEQLYAWSHDKRVLLVRHEPDYEPSFWSLAHANAIFESYTHLMISGEIKSA
mgnify:CR=1 FL=1